MNYKEIFKENLKKGNILSLDKLIKLSKDQTQIEELRLWFDKITTIPFLKDLPTNLEEVFIHNNAYMEAKVNNQKKFFSHDMDWEDIKLAMDFLCLKNNKNWNYNNPFISFGVKIHSSPFRATFIHSKITTNAEPKFFFRKNTYTHYPLNSFSINTNSLQEMILNKENLIISGQTGSGKTSFVSSILSLTPATEHIISLEDTKEIIINRLNATQLISSRQKSLDELLSYSLRMSPDRIVLGELRSHEIKTFILALNTGHKGLITTIHANDAKDTIYRLALLFQLYSGTNTSYELALKLITSNVDKVLFMNNKKVVEVIDVYGSEGTNIFFERVILKAA